MGTRDTVRSVVIAFAFLCLVAWNAVLQTKYKSNLEEFERKFTAHDGNFEQMDGKLKAHDGNFVHMEGKLKAHDGNVEQLKGKLENHDRSFKKQENLLKSIDKATSRRIKRSLDNHIQTTGGATYIRWGRTVCPDDTELVYAGVAGGEHSSYTGGGSEYLCLSDDPKFAGHARSWTDGSFICGVELKLPNMNKVLLETTNAGLSPLNDSDVQCAVCRSRSKASMVMIPGTNECSTGWKTEYWGYLMTAYSYKKTSHSYACLDHAPEAGTDGGTKSDGGGVMNHVRGSCGSLPCTPYVSYHELTCVVCTK